MPAPTNRSFTGLTLLKFTLVIFLVACASTSFYVEDGDRAYKKGNYEEAIKQYDRAIRDNQDVGLAKKRILRAQKAWVKEELAAASEALDKDDFPVGLQHLAKAKEILPDSKLVQEFLAQRKASAMATIGELDDTGKTGEAYVRANQVGELFDSEPARERAKKLAGKWQEALEVQLAEAKHEGERVIIQAAIGAIGGDEGTARSAYTTLYDQNRLRLSLSDGGGARGYLAGIERALEKGPFSRAQGALTLRAKVTVAEMRVSQDVKVQREVQQYQAGTRSVPNPERSQLEEEAQQYRDNIQYYRDQNEVGSTVEYNNEQIAKEQESLDYVLEQIQDAPMTLEEPNYIDYPYEIETHHVTASRNILVENAIEGQAKALEKSATVSHSDEAHGGHPQIGLARKTASLPSKGALSKELDGNVVQIAATLVAAARQQQLEMMLAKSKSDANLRATYVLLAAGAAERRAVAKVEETLKIPRIAELSAAFAAQTSLAKVFAGTAPADVVAKANPPSTKPAASSGREQRPVSSTAPKTSEPPPLQPTKPAPPPEPSYPKGYDAFKRKNSGKLATKSFAINVKNSPFVIGGAKGLTILDQELRIEGGTIVSDSGAFGVSKSGELSAIDQRGRETPLGRFKGKTIVFGDEVFSIRRDGKLELRSPKRIQTSREAIVTPIPKDPRVALLAGLIVMKQLKWDYEYPKKK